MARPTVVLCLLSSDCWTSSLYHVRKPGFATLLFVHLQHHSAIREKQKQILAMEMTDKEIHPSIFYTRLIKLRITGC